LWSHGNLHGWASKNIISEIPRAKTKGTVTGTLTPEELQKLLNVASYETKPVIAIGAFTGVRSAELARLDWAAVRWNSNVLIVTLQSVWTGGGTDRAKGYQELFKLRQAPLFERPN
jgi:integrase